MAHSHTETHVELSVLGDICQVDGACKEIECRAGLGWYYFNTNIPEKLMGGCNLRRGISPLQAELEALIWAMQCMLRTGKLTMVFQTNCSDVIPRTENTKADKLARSARALPTDVYYVNSVSPVWISELF
ncbi:unnamed protein product [Microthlaspi erraticum]|uniref:RNase H type-1 domain-containing protein n=1 Tax=Microthlaspi erraticum TaxID=1685480 RepID=A0A6D2KIH1_9BRAS|nr:unnamed protein product [Microthlaspi erraticum]